MEAVQERSQPRAGHPGGGREYPLQQTAERLNRQLGLYLSEGQQRGLATGLLVGSALAGAIVAWSITDGIRRKGL
jgi:hypothetical protein